MNKLNLPGMTKTWIDEYELALTLESVTLKRKVEVFKGLAMNSFTVNVTDLSVPLIDGWFEAVLITTNEDEALRVANELINQEHHPLLTD